MPRWFDVVNKGNKTGEVSIYGQITNDRWYDDDVTPSDFKKALDDLGDLEYLNIYLNSPGGSVFAGITIGSIIKRQNALTHIRVDGLAASIASVILQAGDERSIVSNGQVMVHNVSTLLIGYYNAAGLRTVAQELDDVNESILASYSRANVKGPALQELMDAETWLTAKKAVALGFADYVVEDVAVDAEATAGTGVATINGIFMNMAPFGYSNFKPQSWNNVVEPPKEPIDYTRFEQELEVDATALYMAANF